MTNQRWALVELEHLIGRRRDVTRGHGHALDGASSAKQPLELLPRVCDCICVPAAVHIPPCFRGRVARGDSINIRTPGGRTDRRAILTGKREVEHSGRKLN
ncbi:hypothetical protein PUN28_008756 [Cardiocondyla obscurior]|uniref:Uncharacterized protein n=1 Tax=Cardiocondyla obscurior TaxID=286306 RepID=A0AAW2G2M8_9HYME